MLQSEKKEWDRLSDSSIGLVSLPENVLEQIEYFHSFYAKLVDALRKLVSMKSQLEKNVYEDTDSLYLSISVTELVRHVSDKIPKIYSHELLVKNMLDYLGRMMKYVTGNY